MLYDDPMSPPAADAPPPLDDDTPVELRGLINFLNSRASARRPERFDTPTNAAAFLAHCELGYDNEALTTPDTARLRRLRDAVMCALKDASDTNAWDAINGLSATAPLRLQTTPGPAVSLRADAHQPSRRRNRARPRPARHRDRDRPLGSARSMRTMSARLLRQHPQPHSPLVLIRHLRKPRQRLRLSPAHPAMTIRRCPAGGARTVRADRGDDPEMKAGELEFGRRKSV